MRVSLKTVVTLPTFSYKHHLGASYGKTKKSCSLLMLIHLVTLRRQRRSFLLQDAAEHADYSKK
jgi:hypothetical protein